MTGPDWDAVPPYSGPPPQQPYWTTPPPQQPYWTGQQGYPPPYPQPYAQPYPPQHGHPYGRPYWTTAPGPARSLRPGPVIASAVLAFASAVLVLFGTVYAVAISALLSLGRSPGGIGPWTAVLHLVLAALLVVGGWRVLARDRRWLLGAAALQVVLSVYWGGVLTDLASGTFGDAVVVLPLLYAALALTAAGLTWLPAARAWASRADLLPGG